LREGNRVVTRDAAVEGNRAEAGAAVAERHRAGDGDTVWSNRTAAGDRDGFAGSAGLVCLLSGVATSGKWVIWMGDLRW